MAWAAEKEKEKEKEREYEKKRDRREVKKLEKEAERAAKEKEQESGNQAETDTAQRHVLHLRGRLTPQPLKAENGDVLLWNGEIFDGIEVKEGENDTQILMSHLQKCQSEKDIVHLISKISGPWAMVYWQSSENCLWFGRDIFGRRSLLWHFPESEADVLTLSSVKLKNLESEEIPAVGIFCLKFRSTENTDLQEVRNELHMYPWKNIKNLETMAPLKEMQHGIQDYIFHGACFKYVNFIPHFDCEIPKEIPMTNRESMIKEDVSTKLNGDSPETYLENLLKTDKFYENLTEQLKCVLLKSVTTRVLKQPGYENICNFSPTHSTCIATLDSDGACLSQIEDVIIDDDTRDENISHYTSAKVAILFSGGIDSTVLAALADKCVPENEEIDLMNVAFQQQRQQQNTKNRKENRAEETTYDPYLVPDRQTGLQALAELNPNRKWNFIKVDVTLEELQNTRSAHVRHLVYPLCTVLDDSIGCAIWFAARGRGTVTDPNTGTHRLCMSNAKVILCGMGADEQLAGYARHRVKFKENGLEGLLDEMNLEINRISSRNLGRDDRIISDHGKESRFPFLDESVVEFLCGIPLHYKANLNLPRGLGEKLLLRTCAWQLGLKQTAVLPKRAIQFGSKIAKMENNKEKATDKCSRLT